MTKKVVFKIVGMDCSACSLTIDGNLEDTEGVKESKTNYAKSQTQVMFDPQKINEKEIVKIIRQTGYTVEPL